MNYPIPKKLNNPITGIKKKNKYGNRKVLVEDKIIDSKKEYKRLNDLKLMERAGLIEDLKCQVTFELQPSFKVGNKTIRAINYIADFTYYKKSNHNGIEFKEYIVEDVKPDVKKGKKPYRTEIYKLKKKMFEYKYQIEISEV